MKENAYSEGYLAYFIGEYRFNNPYRQNHNLKKYNEWDDGWCDAKVEYDEQKIDIKNEGS